MALGSLDTGPHYSHAALLLCCLSLSYNTIELFRSSAVSLNKVSFFTPHQTAVPKFVGTDLVPTTIS